MDYYHREYIARMVTKEGIPDDEQWRFFHHGRMSVGVELIGMLRTLKTLGEGAMSSATHIEMSSVLETLLNALGIREQCESFVDELILERDGPRPRYVPDADAYEPRLF